MMHTRFIFDSYNFDYHSGIFTGQYCIETGSEHVRFSEKVFLPVSHERKEYKDLIEVIAFRLHLMLGISYWKAVSDSQVIVSSGTLRQEDVDFWNTVYTYGMGEFFYRNAINPQGLTPFQVSDPTLPQPLRIPTSDSLLLGFGGGKDSIVSHELLHQNHIRHTLFSVEREGGFPVMDALYSQMKYPHLRITRKMDPAFSVWVMRNNAKNGHVPVSFIYAWIGIFVAALTGHNAFVTSNESSADEPNTHHFGRDINHQWSKTSVAELLLSNYLQSCITPDIRYFSLLRKYNEHQITHTFIHLTKYHHVFSSCNRQFSLSTIPDKKWCGKCPKCAFTFLMIATEMPVDKLCRIFGANLFENPALLQIFAQLCGEGMKPFECVGTESEVNTAFASLADSKEYGSFLAVSEYRRRLGPKMRGNESHVQQIHSYIPSYLDTLSLASIHES